MVLSGSSLGTVIVLSNLLGVSLENLVSDSTGGEVDYIVPNSGQLMIKLASDKSRKIIFEDSAAGIALSLDPFEKGESSEVVSASHLGREVAYLLKGKLKVGVGNYKVVITAEDRIAHSLEIPHRADNLSPTGL